MARPRVGGDALSFYKNDGTRAVPNAADILRTPHAAAACPGLQAAPQQKCNVFLGILSSAVHDLIRIFTNLVTKRLLIKYAQLLLYLRKTATVTHEPSTASSVQFADR